VRDSECAFCRIITGHEPARVVLRTPEIVAFFPTEPATLGHTLVVPTDHIEDAWALHDRTAGTLAQAALRVAHAVRNVVHPDGLNFIQSNGRAATQTVPHLHVHVLPRWGDDPVGDFWPLRPSVSDAQQDELMSRLLESLGV
jgi:diadenosine tetraphosphate (Ap4A) HIT family hydrolase